MAARAAAEGPVPRDGDARPDEGVGDVLPDPPDVLVGSPVFSMAFAAVTFDPPSGAFLSALSFAADGAGVGFPRERTLAPPDFSTFGAVVSAPIVNTFAFGAGAESPDMLNTFALGASLFEAVGADGAASVALSPAAGLFAI